MTDMTAAQALDTLSEFYSDSMSALGLIAIVRQALTAPRLPEGLRELMQDLIDYAQSGKVAEPWMVERLEAILTAAPAPAGTHLDVGGRYNFIGQPDRLVYVGRSSGGWHQFEKVEAPGIIWAEIRDSELHLIERSAPAPADSELARLRERVKELEARESNLLSQILDVANVAGDGVPDAIDNDGQPYQSASLAEIIKQAARLRGGSDE